MRPVSPSRAESNARPSVLLVVPTLNVGGAERQASLLAAGLRERSWAVAVATFSEDAFYRPALDRDGIPVHIFRRGWSAGLTCQVGLTRLVRALRPDIVHSFLWSANFRARLASLAAPRVRTVVSLRGFDDDLRWPQRFADRLLEARTDAVVSNCKALQRDANCRGFAHRARHLVIYNGVEIPPQSPERVSQPRPQTIGYVGRLERKKNPLVLGPAVARLTERFPSVRVLVVGDGLLGDSLRREVESRGLAERFEFAGFQHDPGPFYARMDVLVNTSVSEGCCNVLLEAMGAELPVIATAVGGNTEIVRHGETGLLVPPSNPEALASAIGTVFADPALSRRLGARGRELLAERFSIPAMVSSYIALYTSLLRERRAA